MVDMQRDEREINLSIPANAQSAVTGRSAMSSGPAVQLLPGVYNPLSHHQPAAMQHQHYHHHHQHAPAPQHQQAAQPSHHYQWQGQRTPVATAATPPAGARYAFVAPPPAHTTSPSGSAIDHDAGAGNSGMYVLPEQGGWVEQYPEGWYTTATGGAEWAAAAAAAGWGTARLPYGGAWGYAPAPAPPAHHHHHPAAAAAAAYYAVPPHLLHHAAAAAPPLLPRSSMPMRGGMAARGSLSGGGSGGGAAAAVYSPVPAYARTAGLAAAAAAATAMPANTYSSHVDPTNMRYTKLSIYAAFSDGGLLQDAADRLANGSLSPADFPQMRVVQHRGVYFSLDNRRLWAFKTAKITSVPVLVMPLFRKLRLRLETQQYKDSVELRWPNSLVAAGAAGPLETAPNTPLSHGKGLLQAEGMPAGSGPLTTDSDATTVVTNAVTTSAEDRRRHLLSDSATVVEHMSPPVSPSPREASGGAAAAALAAAVAAVSAGAAALDGGSSVGSGGAGAGGAGGALSSDDEEDGMRTPPSSPDDGEELVGEMRGLTLQGVSELTRTPHKYGTGIGKHDVVPLPPRPTFGAAPVSSIAKSRDNSPTAAANAAKAPAFVGGSGGAASGGDASR